MAGFPWVYGQVCPDIVPMNLFMFCMKRVNYFDRGLESLTLLFIEARTVRHCNITCNQAFERRRAVRKCDDVCDGAGHLAH